MRSVAIGRDPGFGDKRAAQTLASALGKRLKAGELHLPAAERGPKVPTFGEYADHYCQGYTQTACKLDMSKRWRIVLVAAQVVFLVVIVVAYNAIDGWRSDSTRACEQVRLAQDKLEEALSRAAGVDSLKKARLAADRAHAELQQVNARRSVIPHWLFRSAIFGVFVCALVNLVLILKTRPAGAEP